MTSAELANHIQSIECKYASFTNKLSLALQYGSSNLECLQNTAFVVKSNLDILKKFYSDGKICTDCSIAGTWLITHVCGYIFSPFTTYECRYFYSTATSLETLIGSLLELNSDNTATLTKQDGTILSGTYSVSGNEISFVSLTGFPVLVTINYDTNCNNLTFVYDNPSNAQEITEYLERISGNSGECEWAEYCITEEEAEDLIKICYKKLSSTCNC